MLYLLVPTFNEEQNVHKLTSVVKQLLPQTGYKIVIVDDGSTDRTVELLREAFDGLSAEIITKPANQGPGDSFHIGFLRILELSTNDDDHILTFEADNTVSVADLNNLVYIGGAGFDLVLASPYAQGGGFQKTSAGRKMLSFGANLLLRFFFDIRILTLSSFVRLYRVGLLRKVGAKYPVLIESKGFFSMAEILLKAVRSGARVIEVPVQVLSAERVGRSKMKIVKTSFEYISMLIRIHL
jgi:dolichol-phosphate mannosyltransferase